MQEFIDGLKLPYKGKMQSNMYIIDVRTSDEFSELFNAISLNNMLRLEDNSVATVNESKFVYTDGYYDVTLEADYNNNFYRLKVENK